MVNAVHDLAMTKTPRGAPSPLRENPVFQKELAEMEGRLRSARAYLHAAADEIQAIAVRDGELDLTARSDIKLASVHVIHDAVRVTEAAYRAAGSTAIFKDGPFERRLRDALSASQQTQARTQNFVTIGRILLDLEPDSVAFL
jgi:alkylation response protein AidB-like acyl-CoA dehydrogenase